MDIPLRMLASLTSGLYLVFIISIFVFLLTGYTPTKLLKFMLKRIFYQNPKEQYNFSEHKMGELTRWFLVLIMLALIYPLGLTAEYLSDEWEDNCKSIAVMKIFGTSYYPSPTDSIILVNSFRKVYGNQNTVLFKHERDLAKNIKEYLDNNKNSDNSNELFKNPPGKYYLKEVKETYYDSKNIIYLIPSYFKELTEIKVQIEFMRSLTFATTIIFHLILIRLMLRAIPFALEKIMQNFKKKIYESGSSLKNFIDHCTYLSKLKLIAYLLFTFFLWVFMNYGWEHLERQYDRRVFGYYIGYKMDHMESSNGNYLRGFESKLQDTVGKQ